MSEVGGVVLVLGVAAIAGLVGIAFGIFFLAPRLARLVDRDDEEPGDRDD